MGDDQDIIHVFPELRLRRDPHLNCSRGLPVPAAASSIRREPTLGSVLGTRPYALITLLSITRIFFVQGRLLLWQI